jgi:hypothetical protein
MPLSKVICEKGYWIIGGLDLSPGVPSSKAVVRNGNARCLGVGFLNKCIPGRKVGFN